MKLFKRIMLAALALCMALGIVGIVTACGKSKPKTVDYSVTVTCDEADVLTSVKVALTKESGEAVTGGEAKSLTEGKATFTLEEGTYKVVLSGYPETYEYAAATVSKASPNATVALTKKTVNPPKVIIDDEYNGTWSNADHTVVIDADANTITINDTAATDITEDAIVGYDFTWDGKSCSVYFVQEDYTKLLFDCDGDLIELYPEGQVPETKEPVDSMPQDFPTEWESEDAGELTFTGSTFTYMDEEGFVYEISENTFHALYLDMECVLTWDPEAHTLTFGMEGVSTSVTFNEKGYTPAGPVEMPEGFPTEWTSDTGFPLTFNGASFNDDGITGTVTKVEHNQDGTYTFTATYGPRSTEITLDWDPEAETLTIHGVLDTVYTPAAPVEKADIDASFDGTWVGDTEDGDMHFVVVIDAEKDTITLNGELATNIVANEDNGGYDFNCNDTDWTIFLYVGQLTISDSTGYVTADLTKQDLKPVTLPDDMPKKWEDEDSAELIFGETSNFTYNGGEGFFTEKENRSDVWYFNATYEIYGDKTTFIFVWVPTDNILYITYDGDINSEEKFTFTPVEEISLPEGLEGTYYDCSGMQETLTIKGTTVTLADSEGEAYLEYTITECTEDGKLTLSVTVEDEEGGDPITTTVPCAFDLEAGTFSYVLDPDSGEAFLVYYKTLPHAESYPEGFTTYAWSNSDFGQELLLTFKQDSCDFTYDGKDGYLYLVEDDYLYAICDGDLLYFKWISVDNTLTLDPDGFFPIEFTPVKAEFDSTEFLALELDGMWYADAYVGNTQQIPIYLNFTKDTTTVKFALNGLNYAEGEVTAYDGATKTITAVIGGDTYYFVYDPATTRITDGNPEGVDSTKNYGPYIHYAFDFDSTSIEAPEWFGFTFAGGETTLSIDGNYLIVNGESRNRIRHYDATKKELIVLFEGAHVFVTYDDGANTLTATPLKDESKISGSFSKVPDPLDPDLAWLDENAWETEEGGSISFEGANVTVNATGINNWKGYITAHAEAEKTLTVYFIGHGTTTITYTDEAVRTLTCTLGGRSFTFTQTVVLTLPEKLNGKWMGSGDWTSVTIEDGKMTVESGRFDKGPYDITNVANEGNSWTFKVTVASSEQSFTYDEGEDTLTVAIYNGVVTFKRYEEPKADPTELWAALSDTEWKAVSGDEVASYQSITISADHTVTITTTSNAYTLKAEDDKDLTYDSETTTWTITIDSTVNHYFIHYNTTTKVLTCGHALYSGTPKVTTFEKVEKAALTLPEAVYGSTWTSDSTSYGYSFVFTSATKVTIQPASYMAEIEVDIEELAYDTDSKTWTFTAKWVSGSITYNYKFTYVDDANTIKVEMYRGTASTVSATITLTKVEA